MLRAMNLDDSRNDDSYVVLHGYWNFKVKLLNIHGRCNIYLGDCLIMIVNEEFRFNKDTGFFSRETNYKISQKLNDLNVKTFHVWRF